MRSTDSDVVRDAVRHFCVSLGTDLSAELFSAITFSDTDEGVIEIKRRKLDPESYTCAADFATDYAVQKILSKWKYLRLPMVNKKNAAVRSWIQAERQNAETNKRFIKSRESGITDDLTRAVISTARRKIAQILGPFKLAHVLARCKWGPGGTSDLSRRAGPDKKMSFPFSVTRRALPYFRLLIETDPAWLRYLLKQDVAGPCCLVRLDSYFTVVEEDEHLTVDKDAETDRNICKQPTGNGFLQQGAGQFIRGRLLRFGIDLDDQSVNQELARLGHAYGLSTLDMKSASDTISTELVYELLPIDWAIYLDDIRTRYTRIRGIKVRLAKFAAMGNAYTFELESLIFYALGWALAHSKGESFPLHWVYGDDIICLEENATDLIKVLAFCGFTTNEEKSFIRGKFRESCGRHFFEGREVTPFFLKKTDDSLPEIVRFANRLVRWSYRLDGIWRSQRTSRCWRSLYESVPAERRPMVPLGYPSDDGFLVPCGWLNEPDRNHGYLCKILVYRSELRRSRTGALYPYKLRLPEFSNSHPRGWEFLDRGRGRYMLRTKHIPLSSLLIGETHERLQQLFCDPSDD